MSNDAATVRPQVAQEKAGSGVGRGRKFGAALVSALALVLLAAGSVVPLIVLDPGVLTGVVSATAAILAVFAANGLMTLAALLRAKPIMEPGWGRKAPVYRHLRFVPTHFPESLVARMLEPLGADAAAHYAVAEAETYHKRNRGAEGTSHGAPAVATGWLHRAELADRSGRSPAVRMALAKEDGEPFSFGVSKRAELLQTVQALYTSAGRFPEGPEDSPPDFFLVCGAPSAEVIDPARTLVKLEAPDLRDEWWASPETLESLNGTPVAQFIDLLNDFAHPNLAARVGDGWAAVWTTATDIDRSVVDSFAWTLHVLINDLEAFNREHVARRVSDGSRREIGRLESGSVVWRSALRRAFIGAIATMAAVVVATTAAAQGGDGGWADGRWQFAAIQAGVLVAVGLVVLRVGPDYKSRQKAMAEQCVDLARTKSWTVRREGFDVMRAWTWPPRGAVARLSPSPLTVAPEDSPDAGSGAGFVSGDTGRWPGVRTFVASVAWVKVSASLPRVSIADRSVPAHLSSHASDGQVELAVTGAGKRWRTSAGDPAAAATAIGARATAMLDDLPAGKVGVHIDGGTVMVWQDATHGTVDLDERLRWTRRFADAVAWEARSLGQTSE